jgi:hypothetical protein
MHGTFDGEEFGEAIVEAIKNYVESNRQRTLCRA